MESQKNELVQFISENETGQVEVSPNVSYSMLEVNNRSYRLYNAMFESGEFEENGFQRVFMRKIWVVYRTLIQGSDLDLKHMTIRSLNGVKVRLIGMLRMAYQSHLSRTFFGEFIDKVMADMCWFGSSIVKRFDGKVDTVDLRNYITEANVKNPQERRHAELVLYSYDQMLANKDAWKESWSDIETLWDVMTRAGESKFKVVEFWTWGEIGGQMHKICIKYLDNTLMGKGRSVDQQWQPYIELERFKTPYKKRRTSKKLRQSLGEYEEMFPYEQFDLFSVPGRGQGMGCGELLAAPQMVYNELYNNKRKLDLKGLMGISVHTATQGVNGLTTLSQDAIANLDSGTVITLAPGETFQQLPVDMKSADFDAMETKIYELMRQIIGITAQGTGEEIPASTSATQASINQQTANTVYDYTRERMEHGIKRLFNNGYSDDILNEIDENELTTIIGDPKQLQELDKLLLDNAMNDWAVKTKEQTGLYPSEQEFAAAYEQVRQELLTHGDIRWAEIKKDLLKNMEFYVDFSITDESVDTKGRFDALTAMKNDPNSTKSKAKLEDEILNLQGLNPRQYDKSPEEIRQEEAQRMQDMQMQNGMMTAPQPVNA